MKIVFTFETGNLAFQPDHGGLAAQTAAIVKAFARQVRQLADDEVAGFTHPLRDYLGNVVGHATVEG